MENTRISILLALHSVPYFYCDGKILVKEDGETTDLTGFSEDKVLSFLGYN